jgi:transcriptional regulator with XRE-family HTH domain
MRSRRLAAGLSVRQLAERASLAIGARREGRERRGKTAAVSASYVSLIENSRKVPNRAVAVSLADALGDDPALYRAWVAVRKHTDLDTALAAAETLKKLLAAARDAHAPGTRVAHDAASAQAPPFARLRVPVIPEGADPGEGIRPACDVLEWRRLDAGWLSNGDQARLDRPFAVRLGNQGAVRVRGLLAPGEDALILRAFVPLATDAVYAVRHGGKVLLSRVLWNRRQLLLLPAEGESDFAVLEAGDESRLRSLILGEAVTARFEPEAAGT